MSKLIIQDISSLIHTIRNQRVILDGDLAKLYGVTTKALNQAAKRNADRFPEAFMFRLSSDEAKALQLSRSQSVTLKRGQNVKHLPHVFTEHGALMAANVLNSPAAVKMSVALVEAFIRLRQELATTQALARKIAEIERTVVNHDVALKELFRAIKPLLLPPPDKPKRRIGFHP